MGRRRNRSPFNVTIDDAINQARRSIAWMERNYPRMVSEQKISSWTAQHKEETMRYILNILLKEKKERQSPELFAAGSKTT